MQFNGFRSKEREAKLDAEIRSHLDETIRDRIERGETPDFPSLPDCEVLNGIS
jgi:hypothetical protein